jgi:hypothetical protein
MSLTYPATVLPRLLAVLPVEKKYGQDGFLEFLSLHGHRKREG